VNWKRASARNRRCAYCGIDSTSLYRLAILNVRNKKPYESIGVDRRNNSKPYTLDNIHSCCGLCNAIKGGILTDSEMRDVGKVLGRLWEVRLSHGSSQ
jgi:hypothetical protein